MSGYIDHGYRHGPGGTDPIPGLGGGGGSSDIGLTSNVNATGQTLTAGDNDVEWDTIGDNELGLTQDDATTLRLPGIGPSPLFLIVVGLEINNTASVDCNTVLGGPGILRGTYRYFAPMSNTDQNYFIDYASQAGWAAAPGSRTLVFSLWHDNAASLHVNNADIQISYLGQFA